AGDMVLMIDGIRYNQTFGSGSGSALVGADANAQEINYETANLSAELATGGVRINMVPKEGGNMFKGGFYGSWAGHALESDNFTDALRARGLRGIDTVERLWDEHPELGGPILRDKLWFYVHHRYWGVDKLVADTFFNKLPVGLLYQPDLSRQGHFVSTQSSNNMRLT